jgi:transcriptional regulator NrdR family protein
MDCPGCGHWDSYVDDSRGNADEVVRLRDCPECGCRFETVERISRIVRAPKNLQHVVRQTA